MSNQNVGHGHVFPRPDGVKARCGGPAICHVCAIEHARKSIAERVAAQPAADTIAKPQGSLASKERSALSSETAKRYTLDALSGMTENSAGEWVKYDDLVRLAKVAMTHVDAMVATVRRGVPETPADSTLVLRICTAYEQGFGQAGRDLSNPYRAPSQESEAWNMGLQEGLKRFAEKAEASRCEAESPGFFAKRCDLLKGHEGSHFAMQAGVTDKWPAVKTSVAPEDPHSDLPVELNP